VFGQNTRLCPVSAAIVTAIFSVALLPLFGDTAARLRTSSKRQFQLFHEDALRVTMKLERELSLRFAWA